MPLPLIPLINAGGNIAGQAINAAAQGIQNKKMRQWNEKMYWTQRKNNLEDWQMQAAYNSPLEQMKRLKEAGLNPNLVYGNGADAQMSSPVKSAQVEGWNPTAPQFDLGSVMGSYLDPILKQAQINNLEKQGTLLDVEAIVKMMGDLPYKGALKNKAVVDTEIGKFNLDYKQKTVGLMLEQLQANLQKTYADIGFTLDENDRKELMNARDLEVKMQEILSMKASQAKTYQEIKNLRETQNILANENLIKKWEAELAGKGLSKNDPVMRRYVVDKLVDLVKQRLNPLKGKVGTGAGQLPQRQRFQKLEFYKFRSKY